MQTKLSDLLKKCISTNAVMMKYPLSKWGEGTVKSGSCESVGRYTQDTEDEGGSL